MVFYPSDIFHLHPFGCPLGLQFGSLQQKCALDKCAQNSHKKRLCFFTHQTFSIFIPLVVPWGPLLDPCSKSVILTSASKIHIEIVHFFYPSDIFHLHPFGCPLGLQFGSLQQKCALDKCAQNSHKKRLCFFTHQTFSIFIPLVVPWGPLLDPCSKSVILTSANKIRIKVVHAFFTHQTFPIYIPLAVPWGTDLDPRSKSVFLTSARKNHIKSVYVFLPIRHFPFSLFWLFLGVPIWILAAKV